MNIPLKLKYRVRKPPGFKSRNNNSGKKANFASIAPRRRTYGPFWWRVFNSQRPIVAGE